MKGTARIVSRISGSARATAGVVARAFAFGLPPKGVAVAMKPMDGSAERIRDTGLRHWITVTPEAPQNLVWLVPQVGIDYAIETSTGLNWKII